jgi:hypothetical protein
MLKNGEKDNANKRKASNLRERGAIKRIKKLMSLMES